MALTAGTNCGFVPSSPTADPAGTNTPIDNSLEAFKHTAPSGAIKINEVGWYCDNATEAANFQIGLYSHNSGTNQPSSVLYTTGDVAKGTGSGWKVVTVDWAVTSGTVYWFAVQLDNTTTTTNMNYGTLTGGREEFWGSQSSLKDPWGSSVGGSANLCLGIYGRYQTLALGTNAGFVTAAPTTDPLATNDKIDDESFVMKDISPSTATKITEVGWWCDTASEEANYEVALYAADGATVPGEAGTMLYSATTNAKGTSAGWKSVTGLNWPISGSTAYWLGVQLDDVSTITFINDQNIPNGYGYDRTSLGGVTTLPNPYGGGALTNTTGTGAIYAVWEASAAAGTSNFGVNVSDSWRSVDKTYVNVNDAWREVQKKYVNVGDAWREVVA